VYAEIADFLRQAYAGIDTVIHCILPIAIIYCNFVYLQQNYDILAGKKKGPDNYTEMLNYQHINTYYSHEQTKGK
jgi:hypothetical protein